MPNVRLETGLAAKAPAAKHEALDSIPETHMVGENRKVSSDFLMHATRMATHVYTCTCVHTRTCTCVHTHTKVKYYIKNSIPKPIPSFPFRSCCDLQVAHEWKAVKVKSCPVTVPRAGGDRALKQTGWTAILTALYSL